jgi:hypothetical protein
MDIQPGDILLQRPICQLLWCMHRNTWPGIKVIFQALFSILALPFTKSLRSHALQVGYSPARDCIRVYHTSLGYTRSELSCDLSPGLLETALVSRRFRHLYDDKVDASFHTRIGLPVNLFMFFLTPIAGYLPVYGIHNCTHFIAHCWRAAGKPIVRAPGTDVAPKEFL